MVDIEVKRLMWESEQLLRL